MERLVARWQSRNQKHGVVLAQSESGHYFYKGTGCGGSLVATTEQDALAFMEAKVDSGYFLPDSYKTKMIRTQ